MKLNYDKIITFFYYIAMTILMFIGAGVFTLAWGIILFFVNIGLFSIMSVPVMVVLSVILGVLTSGILCFGDMFNKGDEE